MGPSLEPPNFVVDTLISPGCAYPLAGSPWQVPLALWLAVTVAKGETGLGNEREAGTTPLSLLWRTPSFASRTASFEITEDAPDGVHFCTECAPIGQG